MLEHGPKGVLVVNLNDNGTQADNHLHQPRHHLVQLRVEYRGYGADHEGVARSRLHLVALVPGRDAAQADEEEDQDTSGEEADEHMSKKQKGAPKQPRGTAAAGRKSRINDPMAALNSKFQVRGVDRLRVVDASAVARIPGVFPVVATFMISEKSSDIILESAAAAAAAVEEK
ncbi:hypothetical protein MKZ38_002222 [Zalerion maritima]|uniref:Glucose-methanol-choline oxidoreductase C-terminal domain-containing protein n=1 Tax=Zalerion maritima TaxID=339359 RepID=A0AAD5WRE7_9PEZI|nr:hypothetical protein MKZ38_002222 [Zalerion maritima]